MFVHLTLYINYSSYDKHLAKSRASGRTQLSTCTEHFTKTTSATEFQHTLVAQVAQNIITSNNNVITQMDQGPGKWKSIKRKTGNGAQCD